MKNKMIMNLYQKKILRKQIVETNLTVEQIKEVKEWLNSLKRDVKNTEAVKYYNLVFGTRETSTGCSSCTRRYLRKIQAWVKLYDEQNVEEIKEEVIPTEHLTFEQVREEITEYNKTIVEDEEVPEIDINIELVKEEETEPKKRGRKKKEEE